MTTPSTLEFPLRTATAFFVAATTDKGLAAAAAAFVRGFSAWGELLMESPAKEEGRRGCMDEVGKEDERRRWDGDAWETM